MKGSGNSIVSDKKIDLVDQDHQKVEAVGMKGRAKDGVKLSQGDAKTTDAETIVKNKAAGSEFGFKRF
ncbi:hypothetical protein A2U01_0087391, partial [Trifolium medium]|nr:hypothetical protein [Trifolium medium]